MFRIPIPMLIARSDLLNKNSVYKPSKFGILNDWLGRLRYDW